MNRKVPNYNERNWRWRTSKSWIAGCLSSCTCCRLISRSLKITRIHNRKSMSSVFIKFWWNMNFIMIHWNPSYSSLFTENKREYDTGYIFWLIWTRVLNINEKMKQFILKFEFVHIKFKIMIFNTKNFSDFLLLKCNSYKQCSYWNGS